MPYEDEMLKALRLMRLLKIKVQGNISGGMMSDLNELVVFHSGLPCSRYSMGPTNGYPMLKEFTGILLAMKISPACKDTSPGIEGMDMHRSSEH